MATVIYFRNQPTVLVSYDLLLRRELFANIVLDDEEEEAGIINTHGMMHIPQTLLVALYINKLYIINNYPSRYLILQPKEVLRPSGLIFFSCHE